MLPSSEQIQEAAYQRWLRRGCTHGFDREDWYAAKKELNYRFNYDTAVEYRLDWPCRSVLGEQSTRRCRFCERTSKQVAFSPPCPIVPRSVGAVSLLTAEVCDECQCDCRDAVEADFSRFWRAVRGEAAEGRDPGFRGAYSVGAFKALVAGALLVMPEADLAFFPDALEWVNNPDHDYDGGLFAGASCRVYSVPFLRGRAWTGLARRTRDESALPYMLYFLGYDGIVLQVHVPLSLRDEDLDGQIVSLPERSFIAGHGHDFHESRCIELPLASTARRHASMAGHAVARR